MHFCLTQEAVQFRLTDHHAAKTAENPEVTANSGSPKRGIGTTATDRDIPKRKCPLEGLKSNLIHTCDNNMF
jgi:hypothetical protein